MMDLNLKLVLGLVANNNKREAQTGKLSSLMIGRRISFEIALISFTHLLHSFIHSSETFVTLFCRLSGPNQLAKCIIIRLPRAIVLPIID